MTYMTGMTLSERIESNIERIPFSGCWLWRGTLSGAGYGVFTVGKKKQSAHRTLFAMHRGEIPNGLWVLHHCDVRCCVNPAHLFLGDHAANMADRKAKGRYNGEWNGRAKLTIDQVRQIRAMPSIPYRKVALQFGISGRTVRDIRQGKKWGQS